HTLVPLHPLPGRAHRRQAEVRPPPPNSQRKGSRCDRCPCEDHAQLWRAQKQLTQAVCSRRRLHTPVRSPRLVHSSTNASLHTTGGVSPPTSLPACDRRPAACRLRGPHMSLPAYPPLALLADERARLYGRRREDAKDEERLATLSKWRDKAKQKQINVKSGEYAFLRAFLKSKNVKLHRRTRNLGATQHTKTDRTSKTSIRVVYCSSCNVRGEVASPMPQHVHLRVSPGALYTASDRSCLRPGRKIMFTIIATPRGRV
ncbi:unnamed protein product, partial [Trichogramma brassicae]